MACCNCGASRVGGFLTVTGEGKLVAVPDKAVIECAVSAFSKEMGGAVPLQAQKAKEFMERLTALGVQKKDIATTGYSYQPEYEYPQKNKPTLRGYNVVESFRVSVSLVKASSVIDAVAKLAMLQGVSLVVSNADMLRKDAIDLAIDDAKAEAARRAERLGVTLGQVLECQEQSYDRPQPHRMAMAMAVADSPMAAPEIAAGETVIVATILVKFEVLPPSVK